MLSLIEPLIRPPTFYSVVVALGRIGDLPVRILTHLGVKPLDDLDWDDILKNNHAVMVHCAQGLEKSLMRVLTILDLVFRRYYLLRIVD